MRKQTKLWTTKNGSKIRICDMDDEHLDNTIAMLNRGSVVLASQTVLAGYRMLSFLQGEMAIDSVERELDYIEEYGIDPFSVHPLYENLTLEKERRSSVSLVQKIKSKLNKLKGEKVMSQENLRTWSFPIAGVQHHNSDKCIDKMAEGDYLNLVAEPTNKYDANAVRIEWCSDEDVESPCTMLGYVPGKISASIAAALVTSNLTCQITLLDRQAKSWERIKVEIKEVKENA